jgi:hypothetical protein
VSSGARRPDGPRAPIVLPPVPGGHLGGDGLLVDSERSWGEAEAELFERHGVPYDPAETPTPTVDRSRRRSSLRRLARARPESCSTRSSTRCDRAMRRSRPDPARELVLALQGRMRWHRIQSPRDLVRLAWSTTAVAGGGRAGHGSRGLRPEAGARHLSGRLPPSAQHPTTTAFEDLPGVSRPRPRVSSASGSRSDDGRSAAPERTGSSTRWQTSSSPSGRKAAAVGPGRIRSRG